MRDNRCPYVATDPITTRPAREDGWRCGHSVGHVGEHTLYSADGEYVLFPGPWKLPETESPRVEMTEPVNKDQVVIAARAARTARLSIGRLGPVEDGPPSVLDYFVALSVLRAVGFNEETEVE